VCARVWPAVGGGAGGGGPILSAGDGVSVTVNSSSFFIVIAGND